MTVAVIHFLSNQLFFAQAHGKLNSNTTINYVLREWPLQNRKEMLWTEKYVTTPYSQVFYVSRFSLEQFSSSGTKTKYIRAANLINGT